MGTSTIVVVLFSRSTGTIVPGTPRPEAQEMWKALDAASREAKRAAREARKAAAATQPPSRRRAA